MNVVIIGAGYVGVTTAVSLAERGHDVTVVELDETRREALNQGTPAFYEPGLEEALAPLVTGEQPGPASPSIQAIGDIQHAPPSEVVLLCVGTPQDEDGSADLTQVQAAAEDAARAIQTWEDTFTVVATKSTVPPGTGRDIVAPALEQHVGTIGEHVGLGSNPEFLREGNALEDARNPDRIVLGASEERSARVLRQLYEVDDAPNNGANGAPNCPIVTTTIETAETIKYAANALLATKIAFANELANLCEPLGVNVDEVVHATGLDKRINASFLQSGVGFGGSCFPKDLAALAAVGRQHGVEMGILNAALANNERQPLRILEMARETLGHDLTGKRIALLGLAFKPGTGDVRETRALPIYQALTEAGAEVICCDPIAGEEFAALVEGTGGSTPTPTVVEDATVALDQAHACILQTAWPVFSELEPATFTKLMADEPVVLDGRRALDAQALEAAGVTYRAIGRGDLSTVPPQGDPQR